MENLKQLLAKYDTGEKNDLEVLKAKFKFSQKLFYDLAVERLAIPNSNSSFVFACLGIKLEDAYYRKRLEIAHRILDPNDQQLLDEAPKLLPHISITTARSSVHDWEHRVVGRDQLFRIFTDMLSLEYNPPVSDDGTYDKLDPLAKHIEALCLYYYGKIPQIAEDRISLALAKVAVDTGKVIGGMQKKALNSDKFHLENIKKQYRFLEKVDACKPLWDRVPPSYKKTNNAAAKWMHEQFKKRGDEGISFDHLRKNIIPYLRELPATKDKKKAPH